MTVGQRLAPDESFEALLKLKTENPMAFAKLSPVLKMRLGYFANAKPADDN